MSIINPILFVEINESNYIFVAGIYNEDQNLRVIEKIITSNDGIKNNKFINIENASNIIKKNINLIEKKLNYVFKDLIIIIDNFDYTCLNISGSKKLNGSQVLKENISYILNSLKLTITENEKKKTILHIFNSKSILDGSRIENLPIGLFGNFYTHELTFFLIENNYLKNIKQIFNKNNLEIKKVILKSFSEGAQLINKNKVETFLKIKIGKENSNISFFDQSSFRYSENFNFGTNIILKDISKICSLEIKTIATILNDSFYQNEQFNENEFLEKKYFSDNSYRKIRKNLILDIANARIEEIADIILNKNINIKYLKKDNLKTYVIILDQIISDNFNESLKSNLSKSKVLMPEFLSNFEIDSTIINSAGLTFYGWKKEAIPVIQRKNSIITRIFNSIFQ